MAFLKETTHVFSTATGVRAFKDQYELVKSENPERNITPVVQGLQAGIFAFITPTFYEFATSNDPQKDLGWRRGIRLTGDIMGIDVASGLAAVYMGSLLNPVIGISIGVVVKLLCNVAVDKLS